MTKNDKEKLNRCKNNMKLKYLIFRKKKHLKVVDEILTKMPLAFDTKLD